MGSIDPIQYKLAQQTSKPWVESSTIRYLFFTLVAQVLLQLTPMLQKREIDWWVLGGACAANLAGILIKLSSPDVKAPGAEENFLNKNNYPAAPK